MSDNKCYIFFTDSIVNIGGGQLYVKAKMEYLHREGWTVYIYSHINGEILIREFIPFTQYIYTELNVYPFYLSRYRREKILKTWYFQICNTTWNEIIIESNTNILATWSECFAAMIGAKHIIYNYHETPTCIKRLYDFACFKHKRKEFVGITSQIICNYFKGYLSISKDESYSLEAYGANKCIVDYDSLICSKIKRNAKTICVLGRFEKGYVSSSLLKIKSYICANSSTFFNLIYIGGESKGNQVKKSIENTFLSVTNVNLMVLGFLYPLPLQLIQKIDVCIASSGAARAVHKEGIPVITFDANDHNPIGILGYDTINTLYRESELNVNLESMLDLVLTNRVDIHRYPVEYYQEEKFSEHMKFIDSGSKEKAYNLSFLKNKSFTVSIKKLLIFIIGIHSYLWIYKISRYHRW